MKNEFTLAFNEVLEEKRLPKEVVLEALEAAMVSAYRRAVNASNAQMIEAKVDTETGKVTIFAEKEVVEDVQDSRTEVSLEEAHKVDENAEISSMVVVETTPQNFGRVAAQNARQVIQQRIREAEREAQLEYFGKQLGEIVSGVVQAVNPQAVTMGLDMKAEGIMPRSQQIPGERNRLHERMRALLLEVKSSSRGPQLILSRAHRSFLRRLLENEVPEIFHGLVEIRSIAREPGQRSKVAVAALQAGVDPVGACVGIRGVRIQAIVRELNDEKIDVIEWNPDQAAYIAKALSPARVTGVYLNEHTRGTKTATVVVPEDQLSLAIGRNGQNARLAAKLTSWRIDIKSLPEATSDALFKLGSDPEYASIAKQEAAVVTQIESILTKKNEGRPVMPEEYSILSKFVDRVERNITLQRDEAVKADKELKEAALATIPEVAFEMSLDVLDFTPRLNNPLINAGYKTIGGLMLQMNMDSDKILALNGIGPKSMETIEVALNEISLPEPEEEQPVDEIEAEEAAETPEPVVPEEVGAEPVAEVSVEAEPTEEEVPELKKEEVEPVAEAELAEVPEGEPVAVKAPEEEEIPSSLDEIFALTPEVFEVVAPEEEEEEIDRKKEKKKKKKKYIQMEYDPDKDVVIVKRQRKRGGEDWEEDWDT